MATDGLRPLQPLPPAVSCLRPPGTLCQVERPAEKTFCEGYQRVIFPQKSKTVRKISDTKYLGI